MKLSSKTMVLFVFLTFIIITFSCDLFTRETPVSIQLLQGKIEKGPFNNGTVIDIFELDAKLKQTGISYSTSISDNNGNFELENLDLSSQYVLLIGQGYYFNEISGENSQSVLTLSAYSDVLDKTSVNINLLTHLEKERIEVLIKEGIDFSAAKSQALEEILNIFGLSTNGIANSEDLTIRGADIGNAKLLAISIILQGDRSVADLSELLANLSNDIKEDGRIDSEQLKNQLLSGVSEVENTKIRENLEVRFAEIGIDENIPEFEKYIDSLYIGELLAGFNINIHHCDCFMSDNGIIEIIAPDDGNIYVYHWDERFLPHQMPSENMVNFLAPGKYRVAITDESDNLIAGLSIKIDEPDPIEVEVIVTHSDLGESNGEITVIPMIDGLEAVNEHTYIWRVGSEITPTSNTTNRAENLSLGFYEVTVLDEKCGAEQKVVIKGSFTDNRDQKTYQAAKIGENIWMANNLDYATLEGSYYMLDDPETYADEFGRLYEWETIMNGEESSNQIPSNVRGICPNGWHLPSQKEFEDLVAHAGQVFGPAADELKLNGAWPEETNNLTGFSAVPSGGRLYTGQYLQNGNRAFYWSCTLFDEVFAYRQRLIKNSLDTELVPKDISSYAFSVRCIKN